MNNEDSIYLLESEAKRTQDRIEEVRGYIKQSVERTEDFREQLVQLEKRRLNFLTSIKLLYGDENDN